MRRRLILLAALPLLTAAGPLAPAHARSALPAFETCDDLVAFARGGLSQPDVVVRALPGRSATVTPRSPSAEPPPVNRTVDPGAPTAGVGNPMPVPAMATADAGAGDDTATVNESFSGTNTQEEGVDEPDVVKTDGKRLFVVAGAALLAYDVTGDTPRLISKLDLEGAGGELLLRGDRLLVLGIAPGSGTSDTDVARPLGAATRTQTTDPAAPVPAPPMTIAPVTPVAQKVRLAEIDVRDTAAMKIVRTMLVPGQLVTARMTGGTIRVVLSSPATVDTPAATPSGTSASAARVAKARKKKPGLANFVPRTVLASRRTNRTFRRDLVPCDHVRHPTTFAGLDLLTVLSVNFDDGLFNVDRDAVMASAQVVYASPKSLYVASMAALDLDTPADVPRRMKTQIHRFDASEAGQTTYRSSGSVSGFVLNSYAMSESAAGDLRVASTESPLWMAGAQVAESSSAVTILRTAGTRLEPVGRVGGLGANERIYASRFIGDLGYLVTFRQTDPLYTLDLSDPTAPKVAGELKINGYSAYLHPIGDDLLLGVGQDATDTGRRLGAQASIFDVSNPAAPVRTAQLPLVDPSDPSAGSSSSAAAEFDPHAFLWWAPSKLAILPVSGYDWATYRQRSSAVGVRAGRSEGLTKVGEITHGPAWDQAAVDRSLVVGDRVFTISDLGISANRMPGLEPLGFAAFR